MCKLKPNSVTLLGEPKEMDIWWDVPSSIESIELIPQLSGARARI